MYDDLKPYLQRFLLMVVKQGFDSDAEPEKVLLPHLDLVKLGSSISNFLFGHLAQKYYCTAFPYKKCNINSRQLRIPLKSLRRQEC